eukprot:GHVN01090206.1.p1 GENE.GHVN01090206.1~~GHVN01090206.1.p1  ORF type:complete len:688 (+),score=148.34 GHVN01090206.1:1731-3794(+)
MVLDLNSLTEGERQRLSLISSPDSIDILQSLSGISQSYLDFWASDPRSGFQSQVETHIPNSPSSSSLHTLTRQDSSQSQEVDRSLPLFASPLTPPHDGSPCSFDTILFRLSLNEGEAQAHFTHRAKLSQQGMEHQRETRDKLTTSQVEGLSEVITETSSPSTSPSHDTEGSLGVGGASSGTGTTTAPPPRFDDEDRMIYISWIPKRARAYSADKRGQEEELRKRLKAILRYHRLGGLRKVLLFPPKGLHCKLIFDTRGAAERFYRVFGGDFGETTTENWKNLVCQAYQIKRCPSLNQTQVRIGWAGRHERWEVPSHLNFCQSSNQSPSTNVSAKRPDRQTSNPPTSKSSKDVSSIIPSLSHKATEFDNESDSRTIGSWCNTPQTPHTPHGSQVKHNAYPPSPLYNLTAGSLLMCDAPSKVTHPPHTSQFAPQSHHDTHQQTLAHHFEMAATSQDFDVRQPHSSEDSPSHSTSLPRALQLCSEANSECELVYTQSRDLLQQYHLHSPYSPPVSQTSFFDNSLAFQHCSTTPNSRTSTNSTAAPGTVISPNGTPSWSLSTPHTEMTDLNPTWLQSHALPPCGDINADPGKEVSEVSDLSGFLWSTQGSHGVTEVSGDSLSNVSNPLLDHGLYGVGVSDGEFDCGRRGVSIDCSTSSGEGRGRDESDSLERYWDDGGSWVLDALGLSEGE